MRAKISLATVAVASVLAIPAWSQTVIDASSLQAIDELDIFNVEGSEIGEVEEVLVDQTGTPVAIVAELDDGPLGITDDEVILSFGQLSYRDGGYVTELTPEQLDALPRYDD